MIIHGDSLEELKKLEDNSVDSVVTDPPYELGFMGKSWDASGIAYNVELWQEIKRVLKPGGHLLSFGGSRTYHRMTCAIEDAGFEIRDCIQWLYGSGFPKSYNIGKGIQKLKTEGNASWNGTGDSSNGALGYSKLQHEQGYRPEDYSNKHQSKSELTEEEAKEWEGWGTALKPAHEPIVLARKPLSEKSVAQNVLKWKTGGLNIDGCRVECEERVNIRADRGRITGNTWQGGLDGSLCGSKADGVTHQGRFPANFIHDGSDEVVEKFPETKSGNLNAGHKRGVGTGNVYVNGEGQKILKDYGNDSGSAARFFYCAKASKSERNKGLDSTAIVLIEYKVWNETHTTQEERKVQLLVDMDTLLKKDTEESGTEMRKDLEWNTLLFGKELTEKYQKDIVSITKTETSSTMKSVIWNWLVCLLTKEYIADVKYETESGGNLVATVENSNTLITTINEKMASRLGVKNVALGTQLKISVKEGNAFHPTIKPVSLMRYLCKLITPPEGKILDPFLGSGTTGIAAKLEGFNFIGIEKEEEYVKIAEARIEAWERDPQEKLL